MVMESFIQHQSLDGYHQIVNGIVEGIGWRELDEAHQAIMRRFLAHGGRDDALLNFVLGWKPTLIPEDIDRIHLHIGAWLHDIGKTFVTEGDEKLWDRIFTQEPVDDGWRKIHNHPTAGYDAIVRAATQKNIQVPTVALDLVRMHQERPDGSGYPDHLTGDAIPAYVKLFSVVDFVVGMGEDHEIRPYREAGCTLAQTYTVMRRLGEEGKLKGEYVEEVFGLLSTNDHMSNPQLEFLGTRD